MSPSFKNLIQKLLCRLSFHDWKFVQWVPATLFMIQCGMGKAGDQVQECARCQVGRIKFKVI